MTQTPIWASTLLATAIATAVIGVGCQSGSESSETTPTGYSFTHDVELKRRVLRIGFTIDEPAECFLANLPVDGSVNWKSQAIDPALYEELLGLLRDEARIPSYRTDTLAIECNEWNCRHPSSCDDLDGALYEACERSLPEGCVPEPDSCVPAVVLEECTSRPNDQEFCYRPEAATMLQDAALWRFALSDEFVPAISRDSRDLVDAFLAAHDACWNP